ncbi:hypothetical protein J3330_09535 [Leuconostoc mesenteroides]|uniref:hypothetical protein n=1 Tax=Leuconostoc mesenteroides TaxID=1245 RepID=UPI001CBB46F8|nr:hypothetical protein [Leuconostoc mesenteroides]MBZ1519334.1 hypothetical protein [Leuconostoc mesenteroides]MBZ1521682.1 hypothetical protein [Leuconostoc mesenteroides]
MKKFENQKEIIDYLEISKATFYRRTSALGIKPSKRSFSDIEIDKLRNFGKNDNDSLSKLSDMRKEIKELKKLLSVKNQQIDQAHKLVDQAQKLQLLSESRTQEAEQQLIEIESKNKSWFRKLFSK